MKRHVRRPPRSRSCEGKKTYARADAEDTARYVADTTGALMSAYRCPHGCTLADGSPAWHIGHTSPRRHQS